MKIIFKSLYNILLILFFVFLLYGCIARTIYDSLCFVDSAYKYIKSNRSDKELSSQDFESTTDQNLSVYYLERGKYFESKEEYYTALNFYNYSYQLDPDNLDALFLRGKLKMIYLNDKQSGYDDIKMASELGHDNAKKIISDFEFSL